MVRVAGWVVAAFACVVLVSGCGDDMAAAGAGGSGGRGSGATGGSGGGGGEGGARNEAPDFAALITPDSVVPHLEELTLEIGGRQAGGPEEQAAADYIASVLGAYGYEIERQEFPVEALTSSNVIATKPGVPGDEVVVVGAHMDSIGPGQGAGDNATGVAALIAVGEALAPVDAARTIVLVAFGAEEAGDLGSGHYVSELGDEAQSVVAMINLDTVGMGTDLLVYAGAVVDYVGSTLDDPAIFEPGPRWVLDLALALADELELPFQTSPPETWDGYTGPWSDHYPFVVAGVPVAYFETWDWTVEVENAWFGQQTAMGDLIHTVDDVYANVDLVQVEQTAELAAATVFAIATEEAPVER